MKTISDLSELRSVIGDWKKQGYTIAFVPTMGNLHDGHLSLLEKAHELGDKVVASIFVNPIQFGKGEDYDSYPSTLVADKSKLKSSRVNLLFTPDLNEIYPGGIGIDTRVYVPRLSSILCGQSRPDHFSGVTTVVTKLLINVTPDFALFGEKDFQQLMIVRRMASDLCIPTKIIGLPIVRENDGLAISSRNTYLNEEQRKIAPTIYRTLLFAEQQLKNKVQDYGVIEKQGLSLLEKAGLRPEYFSIRCVHNLEIPKRGEDDFSVLVAAWLGTARLIDNIRVSLKKLE